MKLVLLVFICLSCSCKAVRLRHGVQANPLLEAANLPRLGDVDVSLHARPAIESALEVGARRLKDLETKLNNHEKEPQEELTFADVVTPLQTLSDDVSRPWSLLQHLQSVKEDAALRAAITELEPTIQAFWQSLGQSRPIYDAFVKLQNSAAFKQLSEARQRIVLTEVRDRKLSGVGLDGKEAKEFNDIGQELSALTNNFSSHVLDATAAFNVTVHNRDHLSGVPARALELLANKARQGGFDDATAEKGPWVLGLDAPLYGPVMTYAENRSLREQLFWAMATRASTGVNDNGLVIEKILERRQRSANMLGYANYAEMSFASKMAKSEEVHKLMDSLTTASSSWAHEDLQELKAFAKKLDDIDSVKHWDRGFYIEKLQKKKFNFDSEELRPYFALPNVLKGLFTLSHRLFGTEVEEVPKSEIKGTMWDDSVRLFKVLGSDNKLAGYVYFDTYSRAGQKRGGAWVQPLISRKGEDSNVERYPVAVVVCNFPAPQGSTESLLAFGEVETLFHEFGHALQHVLTKQDDSAVAGLNGVEWDAVEIASQFMEYWVTDDKSTLYSFAKHHETGAQLPENIYKNLKDSMHFRSASVILSQVYLGSIDLRLHENFQKGEDVNKINYELASSILPEPPLKEDRFLCAFQHIFAGGYAAGYYSYQWSKVLSADAFSAFEDNGGLGNEQQLQNTGRKFASTLLALGGGRAPALVFKDFRGREPSTDALLKYSGLSALATSSHQTF